MVTERRNVSKLSVLLKSEKWARERWEGDKIFEVDAPLPSEKNPEKFFVTFPFAYMNGLLHLGHAFSVSKSEFAASYGRLRGKRVLFPMGFHLTGMPIKASVDKIKNELEAIEIAKESSNTVKPSKIASILKIHSKEERSGKGTMSQIKILESMGVPEEEVSKFSDPKKWIEYFPPRAIEDMKEFSLSVDWRRSFVTTDVNPYFDSFVKWQMRQLLNHPTKPKVFEGERPTVYSPVDRQPCLDHDRASGEGVGVQEFTAVKLEIPLSSIRCGEEQGNKRPLGEKLLGIVSKMGNGKVYVVAATMRPETIYGVVCCYVSVSMEYGVFLSKKNEIFVSSNRSARNMAYQGIFEEFGKIEKIGKLTGEDLVGLPLKPIYSEYDVIRLLPAKSVLKDVGTGIVLSVPSDSPEDQIVFLDLLKDPASHGIKEDWVKPYREYPKIIMGGAGNDSAKAALDFAKVRGLDDKENLEIAKIESYRESYTNGVMNVGEFKGKTVPDARALVKGLLMKGNHAFVYYETQGRVVSRSGDECVVSQCRQWFIEYGEEEWKQLSIKHLNQMKFYNRETYNAFLKNFDWIGPWACCREFGLGTRLPWDEKYLVESLSDSTIYMAYYTVSHLLHGGSLAGEKQGEANIPASQMSDYVWDYVLKDGQYKESKGIKREVLDKMRREFDYFYPLDLRCSGKDLIYNHLTFCIYNHVAIFPEGKHPLSFLATGHVLLNGAKMSKSSGNFLTLSDCLKRYGSDATRFTLANSGDSMEDANFLEKIADGIILKLYTERTTMESLNKSLSEGSFRKGSYSIFDKAFSAVIKHSVKETGISYENALYRDCIKYGFYGLLNSFSDYCKYVRSYTEKTCQGGFPADLHEDLVLKYMGVLALIFSPICPHWCEYIWIKVLGKKESVRLSLWPDLKGVEKEEQEAFEASKFVTVLLSKVRSAESLKAKKATKANKVPQKETDDKRIFIGVTSRYPHWQRIVANRIQNNWDKEINNISVPESSIFKDLNLDREKFLAPFMASLVQRAQNEGVDKLVLSPPIDQEYALDQFKRYILKELAAYSVKSMEVVLFDNFKTGEKTSVSFKGQDYEISEPYPGSPSYVISP